MIEDDLKHEPAPGKGPEGNVSPQLIPEKLPPAQRFLGLSRVGTALMSERDEKRLLHMIAQTARDLTGAAFAAFSLRPVNDEGQPLVPSDGKFFQMAAVSGFTAEQEAFFHETHMGSDGLLSPIYRQGVPVLVTDALQHVVASSSENLHSQTIISAEEAAKAYAQGQLPASALPSVGVPKGHPIVRSFLGAPLLNQAGDVLGALLLGHAEPNLFDEEDLTLLVCLASQATVALENARLNRVAQHRTQQLDAIFDSITDGVTLVDGQGTIVRENRAARHLRAAFKDEQLLDTLLSAPGQAALTGESAEQRVQIEHDIDSPQTYLVTAHPFHPISSPTSPLSDAMSISTADWEGTVAGAVVVWHDITAELAQAKERAAQAHARELEAIFEAMTDAVFVFDQDGNVTMTNTTARQQLALLSPADYVTRPLPERYTSMKLADEEGKPLDPTEWPTQRVLAGEVLTPERAAETSVPTRDGHMLYTQVTGGPLHDGDGSQHGGVVIVRNITERKRAEREREQRERVRREEIEAQRELLLMILDELPGSVYLVRGEDARLMLANRTNSLLWGAPWPYNETMHDFLAEHRITLAGPTGQPLPPEQWATLRALRQGETVRQHQETIHRADGSTLPVLVNAVPLGTTSRLSRLPSLFAGAAPDHSEPLALVIHQDVSVIKEAESLKDEFIAIAAHELRNPVAALAGFAQTLVSYTTRGKGPQLSAFQNEVIGEIELAAARLVTLTEELLDVTRLQAGRLHLYPTLTDLVALTRGTITRFQRTTEHCTISLLASVPKIQVMVDPVRIDQVLANLLSNAIKYSPQGGTIDVQIEVQRQQQHVLLTVRDEGLGIPKDEQAQIFSRFKRANNALEAGVLGTGLGLYLCRELLALHGGQIWFESMEGEGSVFFVTLPMNGMLH
ncbi:MAG TPA: ATP-binding protein [Ktedonobacteraceae bacterium]|nr:ATP-binding protein [Ktedonobacteraceae bacterium]